MMGYPESEKARSIQRESNAIAEFLGWVQGAKGWQLAFKDPVREGDEGEVDWPYFLSATYDLEKLLAEFFEIDLDVIENEKVDMLDELKKSTARLKQVTEE